jgi:hypothetical protein
MGIFPWRFVNGELCLDPASFGIGRCVAFVDDGEYDELMAHKAALAKTWFGDGCEPEHVESIQRLTRRV